MHCNVLNNLKPCLQLNILPCLLLNTFSSFICGVTRLFAKQTAKVWFRKLLSRKTFRVDQLNKISTNFRQFTVSVEIEVTVDSFEFKQRFTQYIMPCESVAYTLLKNMP